MKVITSDIHAAPFRAEKFRSQKKSPAELIIQWFAFRLRKKEKRVFEKMAILTKREKGSITVINGDMMEASRTEQGLAEPKDLKAARIIKWKFENFLGTNIKLNAGNHETGYSKDAQPMVTDPEAGISKASIKNFLLLTGHDDLYHSFRADGYQIIFIPYLFTEPHGKDFDIQEEKNRFLKKLQYDLEKKEPVLLFIHDPDSLMDCNLCDLIRIHREQIKGIFLGHYHSELNLFMTRVLVRVYNNSWLFLARWFVNTISWFLFAFNTELVRRIGNYFCQRRNIPDLIAEFGAMLIPAPTGMFGIGGGFLVIDLETLEIQKFSA